MRIVRFRAKNKTKYGVVEGNVIRTLQGSPFTQFKGPGTSFKFDGNKYDLDKVNLLAPCTPTKIVALMFSYKSHIDEAKEKPLEGMQDHRPPISKTPITFLKPSTAVIGPDDNIIISKDASRRIDFEGELAIIIGRMAKEVAEDAAKSYALGYTCFNDVSDRTALQEDNMSTTRSKGYDTFAPMGPWIETDLDPDDVLLETYLNGKRLQHERTSFLRFNVSTLISYISGMMTLLPGDIIATGTPEGMAPMKVGDVVEVKIEKIGTLKNTIVSHA